MKRCIKYIFLIRKDEFHVQRDFYSQNYKNYNGKIPEKRIFFQYLFLQNLYGYCVNLALVNLYPNIING